MKLEILDKSILFVKYNSNLTEEINLCTHNCITLLSLRQQYLPNLQEPPLFVSSEFNDQISDSLFLLIFFMSQVAHIGIFIIF